MSDTIEHADWSEAARAAAAWWAGMLNPSTNIAFTSDPNINLHHNTKQALLPRVTPEQCEIFTQLLVARIIKAGLRHEQNRAEFGGSCPWITIGVDYHPERDLYDAMIAAGIGEVDAKYDRLPLKTVMWIEPTSVQVRVGSNQDEQIIWSKP